MISTGKDVIAQAQSGTGKTATFTIAALQNIDDKMHKVQALILCPVHELAEQIMAVVLEIGKHMGPQVPPKDPSKPDEKPVYEGIDVALCIGGTSVSEDRRIFGAAKQPQIVVGTPGRVLHMINLGVLRTDHVKMFILDEADTMLEVSSSADAPLASGD